MRCRQMRAAELEFMRDSSMKKRRMVLYEVKQQYVEDKASVRAVLF